MSTFLFANNAESTLAGPITAGALSCTLASGTGALFPEPSAGEQFSLSFVDAATGLLTEIVYCTARSGDTCTILRAQEATTAQAWLAGDLASNFNTAGQMRAMVQTSLLYPSRIITASGVFLMTRSDANGAVGLNRTSALGVSSTTLPDDAVAGEVYAIEDLAKNFNAYPVTITAPSGQTIAGASSVLLNVNGQCAAFRYFGSNIWSFEP